jgi:hypothetical protein
MELLDDVGHGESCFGPLGDGVSAVQDRCMVCTERTIGSEIVLDTPDLAPRWLGHVKSSFSLFGDGVSVSVR